MAFKDMKLDDFLDTLASSEPVPGGGSAAAMAGATGAALLCMVGEITMGKKKPEDKTPIEESLSAVKPLVNRFKELADEDSEAFDKVMDAFRMPKENDEEKAARSKAIQEATIGAADVPLVTARAALDAAGAADNLAELGSRNAISDVACGLLFLDTAFRGALYNVEINVSGMNDPEVVAKYKGEVAELKSKFGEIKEGALAKAEARIG
ncbi:MAG: cyclodeaminase/cyclohydrolase family protein [bacterium]|nr:cyclodeaminase/cyclohydrolase family protein [bacterium]